jgi:hypothetical protein
MRKGIPARHFSATIAAQFADVIFLEGFVTGNLWESRCRPASDLISVFWRK